MRHLVWLSGVLLALSCAVDNSNLNVDAAAPAAPRAAAQAAARPARAVRRGVDRRGRLRRGDRRGRRSAVVDRRGRQRDRRGGQRDGGNGREQRPGGGTGPAAAEPGGGRTGGNGRAARAPAARAPAARPGRVAKAAQGGSPSCDTIATEYSTALDRRRCARPAPPTSVSRWSTARSAARAARQYVNDTTMLNTIQAEWTNRGVRLDASVCPAIACVLPTKSTCVGQLDQRRARTGANLAGTCTVLVLTPTN